MGDLLVRYVPPCAAWLLLLSWRGRDAAARRLLLGLAVSLTALIPAGQAAITQLTGSDDLPRLVGHAGMVLAASAAQDFLAHMNGLRRSSRWNMWWTASMFAVMCVLFALTPNLMPQSPWVFEYVVVYVLAQAPAFGNVVRLGLRYARSTTDPVLRVSLRLVVTGTGVGLLYLADKVVLAAAGRFGFGYPLGHTFWVSALLPNTAYVLVLAGAALPAAFSWWRRYRRHARLRPLWRALYEADPAIALNPTGTLGFWNVRLRLYRRVIEIRDGLLGLQPYRDVGVAVAAGQAEASVEAAVIAAAIRARASGALPSASGPVSGGVDLDSDIAYLCEVADAYRCLVR